VPGCQSFPEFVSRASRLGVAVVCAAVASCSKPPAASLPAPGALHGANVLLVTIDTLRQDRVDAYGTSAGLTPTLDGLSANGIRYAHAFSHVPMTLPAHTSIMTGLTPLHHGVRNNTAFRLDDRIPTLAERMKAAGYRTGAFVGAFVLDGRFGLARGFDEYDDRLPHTDRTSFAFAERRADEVLRRAQAWILGPPPPAPPAAAAVPAQPARPAQPAPSAPPALGAPWFAWVHLFDPHAPYAAPMEYRAGRTPYDAEVAYADAMLGRLIDTLRAAHVLDRTLIIVTGDHGESLGEHGERTHGLFAYQSTVAVPLIISGPAVAPGVVETPAAHDDIVPTIIDLVGATPPDRVDGQSLARPTAPDRPIYIEALDAYLTRGWAPLQAVVRSGWKFIDLPDAELYDLTSDGAEQQSRPLSDPHAAPLEGILRKWRNDSAPSASARPPDAESMGRLRSLGYVGGAVEHKGVFTSADDPKRLVALNERFNSALTAFDEGRDAAALDDFLAVLRERPDFLPARTSAATALIAAGRPHDAARILRDAPAEQASSPDLLAKLGAALRDAGDLPGAAAAFARAGEARPSDVGIADALAVVEASRGRTAEARTAFRRALAQNPHAATVWYNLGLMELQNRRPDEAADALRHAVANDPDYADGWRALGFALLDGDRPAAISAWQRAERLSPRDYDLLFNLSMVLAESQTPAEAVPYMQRFLSEAPASRYREDLARVRAALARIERTR
jgi:arylsulfatase A-like enzyme/Flp pilus assembly protein TadD